MPEGHRLAAVPAELRARCTFPRPGSPLTCAVSGGADSLCLLVLAVDAGCEVTAVHVDHGLRPGSASESAVVAAAAERFGARFRSLEVHVDPGPNLEARARHARFQALPADVATGHTADDQVETILINLVRGAGLDGLAGMRPGPLHPILGIRRLEAAELCRRLGLEPVVDPTNSDPSHLRNRVRHELVPLLCDLARRDVVPLIARQAGLLRDEASLLDCLAEAIDPTDCSSVGSAPSPLARRAVRTWLGRGRPHPPDLASVERVLGVASGRVRAAEVAGGRRVRRSRGKLLLDGEPGPPVPPSPGTVGSSAMARRGVEGSPEVEQDPSLGKVLVDEPALLARVAALGEEITEDYRGRPPLLVGVLKGAFMFMSDLARSIRLPVEFDFMAVASYGSATKTSGVVRIVKDLDLDLADRHVLLVEDIVDSGLTLSYLTRSLMHRGPATLEICALLVKEGLQRTPLHLRYVGFRIPPEFVVGYGLDVGERYRNLTKICTYVGDPRRERF